MSRQATEEEVGDLIYAMQNWLRQRGCQWTVEVERGGCYEESLEWEKEE